MINMCFAEIRQLDYNNGLAYVIFMSLLMEIDGQFLKDGREG